MSVQRSEAETAYLDAFAAAGETLPSADWLESARQAARESFAETGLPHRRNEAWRWTDLRTILDQGFPPALTSPGETVPEGAPKSPFATLQRHVVTFVDGHLRADLSDYEGLAGEAECVRMDDGLSDAPDWLKTHFGQGGRGLERQWT